jgi:transcriptional regulator GlxA family with amidase domain
MQVIVILYPNCVFYEIAAALSLLSKDHSILITSPDGKPVQVDEKFTIEASLSYHDVVDFTEVRHVLIPGGDCWPIMDCPSLNTLLEKAVASPRTVVGGICNGALVLANAGLLRNRRCTHTAVAKYAPLPEYQELIDFASPRFSTSYFVDEDVVVDGNIVTAKPWAHALFAARLAEIAGGIDSENVAKMAARLLGIRS